MDNFTFIMMKSALSAAPSSPHPTNKIAAALWHPDFPKQAVVKTNNWPASIAEKIGKSQKIGNSSGTIHAETNAIVNAPFATDGASICITDPFCPNCAKNMVEAGIKKIYIDENGFDGDFFTRRGGEFERMSMRICEQAGISVFAVNIEQQKIRPILEIANNYIPPIDSPIHIEKIDKASEALFQEAIATASKVHQQRKISISLVKDSKGAFYALTARAHVVEGYSMQNPDDALTLLTPIGKYSFIQEPVNRMLMTHARYGYMLQNDFLYCSQVPTSREQVNLIGAGIHRISIGDAQKCRDRHGIISKGMLTEANILDYS